MDQVKYLFTSFLRLNPIISSMAVSLNSLMIQPARAALLKYYVNMYYEMQIQIWRAGNQMKIFLTSFQMQMQPT